MRCEENGPGHPPVSLRTPALVDESQRPPNPDVAPLAAGEPHPGGSAGRRARARRNRRRSLFGPLLLTGCYTAHRPFVYRTLLPTTARLLVAVTPPSLRAAVARVANKDPMLPRTVAWEPPHAFEYVVVIALMFLCLVGYGWTLRALARTDPGAPPLLADFASVLGVIVLPASFRYHAYPYDPSTLLLSALALLALLRRHRVMFYLILVLSALNKETSILLPGLFLLRERGALRGSRLAMHLTAQLSIWASIRAALVWRLGNNPGGTVEWHLLDHNRWLALDPSFYVRLVLLILPVALMVGYRWRTKPRFLRESLAMLLGPLVGLGLLMGYVDEFRGYYDAFPTLHLLILPTLAAHFGAGEE
jgi:hypothetical protein